IFEETGNSENPFYHFAFNIPNNKFDEAFAWINNKVDLLWLDDYNGHIADFVNWKAKSFYFLDPAGNILEMITRLELKDDVDEPFSSRHIRNISEIGLVYSADDFDSNAQQLLKTFPINYFNKQSPLPHFRAIGDDEGLFIIVPKDRVWFSTKKTKSKIFKMQIIFDVEKISYKLKI
ncbi:MAG: VOC family protein, partial [Bacteroidota bacterium]|nr:VOC family protein [Bacteroidota bacterium]